MEIFLIGIFIMIIKKKNSKNDLNNTGICCSPILNNNHNDKLYLHDHKYI